MTERLNGQTIEQWAERAKISERNLAELQDSLSARPEVGLKWISVEDRLPPVSELVIAWTPEYEALIADRTTSNPDHGWSCMGKVTHWMPMPEAPVSPLARSPEEKP